MAYSLHENGLFSMREWPILFTRMAYSLEENFCMIVCVNLFQKICYPYRLGIFASLQGETSGIPRQDMPAVYSGYAMFLGGYNIIPNTG